jgi:hypothetical protein
MKRTTQALRLAVAACMLGGINAGAALADSPASDAAHACLQGLQKDYYEVIDLTPDAGTVLEFGGLAHGSDDAGTYVIAPNHGECTSFVAENSNKPKVDQPVRYLRLTLTEVYISSL